MSLKLDPYTKIWFVVLKGTATVLFFSIHREECLNFMGQ
jgi:hypothetical protein